MSPNPHNQSHDPEPEHKHHHEEDRVADTAVATYAHPSPHDLLHAFPSLDAVRVHVEPWQPMETSHQLTLHHEPAPQRLAHE